MKITQHFLGRNDWRHHLPLVSLTLSIVAIVPAHPSAIAATLAQSSASAVLFNFSHQPQAANAQTFQDGIAIGQPDQVRADALAEAEFLSQNGSSIGRNISISLAQGRGQNYLAQARSEASIVGFDFLVGPAQTFQFDWENVLFVEATSDRPSQERSQAVGLFGLEIYARDHNNQLQLIDRLSLFGSDNETRQTAFNLESTAGFNVSQLPTLNSRFLQGRYAKTVDQATQFTVLEIKRNQVLVQVPEPALILGMTGIACLTYMLRRSRQTSQPPLGRS